MKHLIITATAVIALAISGTSAQAGTSMFHRSYYSHDPVRPVKVGSRPGSVPHVNAAIGGYVRGGVRRLQVRMPDRYGAGDQYIFFEAWGQTGAGF